MITLGVQEQQLFDDLGHRDDQLRKQLVRLATIFPSAATIDAARGQVGHATVADRLRHLRCYALHIVRIFFGSGQE